MEGPVALAIDVGGTKVTVGLVDAHGVIRRQETMPTRVADPAEASGVSAAEALLERVAALAQRLRSEAVSQGWDAPVAAGIGTTGHVDARRGVVLHSGLVVGWSGLDLGPRMARRLGLPVRLLNDGHAMAVAEHRLGAARGSDHALCVAVGTGVGGGLIHEGRLYLGSRGLAGLLGHTTIAFNGRRCQCGKQGCLEAYAAGPRIVDEYHRRRRRIPGDIPGARPPRAASLQEVVRRAENGDVAAIQAIERGGAYLGAGLASLANALNPRVIVVGGGVLGAGPRWFGAVAHTVQQRVRHTVAEGLEVRPAALGPQAVLVGAGLAALEEEWRRP